MDVIALTVGLSWIIAGIVCVALAVPLRRGQIRRNGMYGVRLPQSLASDEAWHAINRYGGKRLTLWAVPMIAAGVAALALPLQSHPRWAMTLAFAPIIFVLIPTLESWRFARKHYGRVPE